MKIEEDGIIIGNVSGSDINITDKFGGIPLERQPKYKVAVKRFRNAGFKITNLANNHVIVGLHGREKLYRGQTKTVTTSGTITFSKGIVYKLHAGIFFVQPRMYVPAQEEISGMDFVQDRATKNVFDVVFGDQDEVDVDEVATGRDRRHRDIVEERIETNRETVRNILDVYSRIIHSDKEMTLDRHFAGFDDNSERAEEINRIISAVVGMFTDSNVLSTDPIRFAKLDENSFENLKDRLLEMLVPDGANEHEVERTDLKQYMDNLIQMYVDKDEIDAKRRRIEFEKERGIVVSDEEEAELIAAEKEIEKRQLDLESRLEYSISTNRGEHTAVAKDFVSEIIGLYDENELGDKGVVYSSYYPRDRVGMKDYFDRHMLNNYHMIIALSSLRDRLGKVPNHVLERSLVAFNTRVGPEENYLPQIIKSLEGMFIMKDDEDVSSDVSEEIREKEGVTSLMQAVFENATNLFLSDMVRNQPLFDAKRSVRDWSVYSYGRREEKLKEYPANPIYKLPQAVFRVEKNSYAVGKYKSFEYKIRVLSGSIISKVNGIRKLDDDKNLIEGRPNDVAAMRGTIYVSDSVGLRAGDRVVIDAFVIAQEFYRRVVASAVGTAAKRRFGDVFRYRIKVRTKESDDLYFHDAIYKIGLDKLLIRLYSDLESGNEVRKKKVALHLNSIRSSYSTLIRRLKRISASVRGERREIDGNYLHALSLIPEDKREKFWSAAREFVLAERRDFSILEGALYDAFGRIGGAPMLRK
jgi:hypothetical protein